MVDMSGLLSSSLYRVASPIRAFVKRWGSEKMRKDAWEKEYRRGEWLTGQELDRPIICDAVEAYCRGGAVLDLGCADGIIGMTLDESKYSRYTGVDISSVAVERAIAKCKAMAPGRARKNSYVAGDIATFVPDGPVDVILFRQSLYYLPGRLIKSTLERYREHLNKDGVFVVVMCDVKRHGWIADIIREGFEVLRDETGGDTVVLVFR